MVVCHIIESSVAPESADGNDEVNLRGSLPAGGPIIFQLLEMPPQAKSINNWTIRKGIMYVEKGRYTCMSHGASRTSYSIALSNVTTLTHYLQSFLQLLLVTPTQLW